MTGIYDFIRGENLCRTNQPFLKSRINTEQLVQSVSQGPQKILLGVWIQSCPNPKQFATQGYWIQFVLLFTYNWEENGWLIK